MRIEYYQKKWKESMCKIKRYILFFCISIISIIGNAQVYKGRVFSSDGQPLEFSCIRLLSLPDSSFIQGTISNKAGEFTLPLKTAIDNNPLFEVSHIGYHKKYAYFNEIDSIVLSQNGPIELAEVVVKGRKNAFVIKDNNLVCNIAGTTLSTEANTYDLIGKLPGFYTQGEQLKSITKGEIKYFLNNRPATAGEVARLDVRTIQSIEIDQHPGSRYSGEVGCVLFIKTKILQENLSAFLRNNTRINHGFSQSLEGELKYQYGKALLTIGGDYGLYRSKPEEESLFELLNTTDIWRLKTNTNTKNKTANQTYFARLEYIFSNEHQVSLSYTKQPSFNNVHMEGGLAFKDNKENFVERIVTDRSQKSYEDNINLYYRGVFGKYWLIDLSSDWFQQRNHSEQTLQEEQRLGKIVSNSKSSLWGFSPRAVYQKEQTKIELGLDWSNSSIQGSTLLNIEEAQPSDNKIQEIKTSGYIGYDWTTPNKKWNINAGIRVERIYKNYEDNVSYNESQAHIYKTILPFFVLSYTNAHWQHQFNYRASVQYPSFNQLTSGEVYFNRYNLRVSNPKLERSVSHHIRYDGAFRWLNLSAGYNYTYQPILETFELEPYKKSSRIKIRPQNLSSTHGIHVIANIAPRFGFYEPRWMVGYIQNFMELSQTSATYSISKPFVILSLNNSFTLPHQWIINLDYSYNGSGSSGYITYSSSSSLNFSILKYFFNRKMQVSLKATDVFNTSTPRMTGTFQDILLDSYSWMDSRVLRISIIYYFNHHKKSKKHSSISSEVNRL